MLGYKSPRLLGMKISGPLRCLLAKLNCISKSKLIAQKIGKVKYMTVAFEHTIIKVLTTKESKDSQGKIREEKEKKIK